MVGATLCCLVLLVAAGGLSWQVLAPAELSPAAPHGEPQFPDRFFAPSPWLDGTSHEGPIGPLIAVIQAERKTWTSTINGVVGVSATSGECRFLDLPGHTADQEVWLSPDGRHVACWITGETSGQPNGARASDAVVGYAVYDTVTGDVTLRETFQTDHGLAAGALDWADVDTLAVGFGQWLGGGEGDMDSSTYNSNELRLRDLSADVSRKVPGGVEASFGLGSSAGGQLVLDTFEDRFTLLDVDQLNRPRTLITSLRTNGSLVIAPDGRTVVGIWAGAKPNEVTNVNQPLVLGTVGPAEQLRMHKVPSYRFTGDVVGWRDTAHVLVRSHREVVDYEPWLVSVDIRTGEAENLSRLDAEPHLAASLLNAPLVHATAPPTPMDPRLKLGLSIAGILAALAGLLALVRWRRRARP